MANRRMIGKNVVESDPFLEMPADSQALYTHLVLNADDDGFIDHPGAIRRMTGFSEDSFKLLVAKGFLIQFPNNVVVVTHWDVQNHIQPTKKTKTTYVDELGMLKIDKQGKYIFLDELSDNCRTSADRLPEDCRTKAGQNETSTNAEKQVKQRSDTNYQIIAGQVPEDCRHSIGKDRLGKDRLGKDNNNIRPNDSEEITTLFNGICKSYQPITESEKYSSQLSKCILKGYSTNEYQTAFINAENSDYLKGLVDNKKYQSDFGWILEHLDDIKNGKYN